MKRTVLNASSKLAKTISDDLLGRSKAFKRRELTDKGKGAFEIYGRRKDKTEVVLFRYTNEAGPMFDYDERLLSFKD